MVILVAGCSSSGPGAPPDPPDPRPLRGAVYFSADQAAALWEAEEAGVRACMQERGHRYLSPGHREGSPAATASPYALLRPERAESDGYGMSAEYRAGPPADPNEDHLAGLSEEDEEIWRRALLGEEENDHEVLSDGQPVTGYDERSCVGAARAELYGPEWPDLYYAMAELSQEVIELTRESGGFRGAEAAWAACMADRGFAYRSLEDPRREIGELLAEGVNPRAAAERERELARTDLGCQRETGLHEEVERAQQEVEQSIGAEARLELERLEQAKQGALERSNAGRE
ncbi:hypothetical protein ACFV5N_01600 [Streptomyces sp. NPDC059853]|uniref:hypothetical protein n=1 Tax=Streptomyces sp. NPDC059853 TaxID=3346973 RepID=UPI003667D049